MLQISSEVQEMYTKNVTPSGKADHSSNFFTVASSIPLFVEVRASITGRVKS